MKNAPIAGKKLSALIRKIGPVKAPANLPHGDDPLAVLVMSFLMWESTTDKAIAGYSRLFEHVVDFNDLRVSMSHETAEILGPRYPRVLDRCQRLRAVLRNIYLREHSMSLQSLKDSGKRDAKKYIESLEGIVPYVAARVLVLSFDTHAIPVDDQLRTHLIEAEVGDPSVEIPELSSWLASQIKAGDGAAVHYAMQSWMDDVSGKVERKPTVTRAPSRKPGERRGRSAAKSSTE